MDDFYGTNSNASFSFDSALDSFTKSTLSLVNSRNQIRDALATGEQSPTATATRQDAAVSGGNGGVNVLLLALVVFAVYKLAK